MIAPAVLPCHRPTLALLAIALTSLLISRDGLAQAQPPSLAKDSEGLRLYQTHVKPLLQGRCYACHGSLKQKAGLRLDTVESMLRGGDSGPVLTKKAAAESLILDRISATDVAERMPPEHEGELLSRDQIAQIKGWIEAGAPAPPHEQPEADPRDHWAFRPVVRPAVPVVQHTEWVRNPIDAFMAQRYEKVGLKPQMEASRTELLRRLSLDLIGLPPTAEEIAAFQSDDAPRSYERTAARLLNDPRHGERWARHWMDVWRYSDWWGLGDQLRNSQKHIWHWRDWIVESLNTDLPYDEMVRLMLAGDELRPNDPAALRATGYLARNYFLFNRHQWMDETVEHVSKAFLGLTMNCAKCHDHKFDPISHSDYYRMRAIFEPYHVRIDLVPGETTTERDGIPRAFDGQLDTPTYRFIRGQESQPDKKSPLKPGTPAVLSFASLKINPIELPAEAWQPGLRPWVARAYLDAARSKIVVAEAAIGPAREKLKKAEQTKAGGGDPKKEPAKNAIDPLITPRLELQIAEFKLAAARAELVSVEHRANAMQLGRDQPSSAAKASTEKQDASRAAAHAEREHNAAQARVVLAEAELRLHLAEAAKKESIGKEVTKAREALAKATKAVGETDDQYTRLAGAQWTPTRFFNSAKDDPEVTFPSRSSGRRKALAEWLTDRRNPLTARVAVNHIWSRHMGTPLVATVFDFGRKGSPPTHPELLDWLTAEFVESGWSMKHLHRLIVESSVYRLSTSAMGAEASLVKDPDNLQTWRRTASRMEAQVVRDSILALAGKLDLTMGGPTVPAAGQADSTRRSLYFFHSNNERNLFLTTFDEALVKECYRREQSIVPQQALALTNSRLVLDSARPIAERLTQRLAAQGSAVDDDAAFVRLTFLVLLGSEPKSTEAALMAHALAAWRDLPEAGKGTEAMTFARTNLVWVVLNHNDFVTLR